MAANRQLRILEFLKSQPNIVMTCHEILTWLGETGDETTGSIVSAVMSTLVQRYPDNITKTQKGAWIYRDVPVADESYLQLLVVGSVNGVQIVQDETDGAMYALKEVSF